MLMISLNQSMLSTDLVSLKAPSNGQAGARTPRAGFFRQGI